MRDLARPIIVLPLALLAMALLIGAAFFADCARIADGLQAKLALADEPVLKSEARVADLLRQRGRLPREVQTALDRYDPAAPPDERQAAFDRLAGHLPLLDDAEEPGEGVQLRDEIQGAVNRRRVALEAYRQHGAEWTAYCGSLRGRVAVRMGSGR